MSTKVEKADVVATNTRLEQPPFLNNLAVANFRAFRRLQIDHLGHVNLIVGKNNVGKISLLEALWLYASFGSPEVIKQILTARNEFAVRRADETQMSMVKHLFYGRENIEKLENQPIHIGPIVDDLGPASPGAGNDTDADGILSLQAISVDQEVIKQKESRRPSGVSPKATKAKPRYVPGWPGNKNRAGHLVWLFEPDIWMRKRLMPISW